MNDNFPIPIFSDDDLTVYENYLNSLNVKLNNETFYELLKANVGKNIKIYIVFGNQLTARQGKLLNVFNDYIVLCKNREKLAIKLSEIKFISVI
ncbi:MAG: hypothetical protein IJD00_06985 [Clostridia bacterium]|nr:hypothetical protein [Clostridia bacterium]MBQ3058678.1 hypothetical protein [Clostridia bacterium]